MPPISRSIEIYSSKELDTFAYQITQIMERKVKAFEHLLKIMDDLRSECPWDKKQTLETLRYLTIEEVYELSDAILENDLEEIKKELGDLMMHIAFYAKIGSEKKAFDIADVIEGINEKLIYRHPHIYSDVKVVDADDVSQNWEQLKMKEGRDSVLEGVPQSLPAMVKAYRMQEKVRGVGFDWEKPEQVWEKVQEELNEFHHEVSVSGDKKKMEAEFGDVLFSMINYARFLDINPEDALERTNKKFKKRFQYLEKQTKEAGKNLHEMSLTEMDVYWEEAKKLD